MRSTTFAVLILHAINRLQLYTMGHKVVVDFTFLARVVQTIFDNLTHEIATGGLVLDKDVLD